METNLEKAKRQIKAHGAIGGYDIPEDGFIFQMLELAATPDKDELDLHCETLLFGEWIGVNGFTWCEADDSYFNPKFGNLISIEALFKLYKTIEK